MFGQPQGASTLVPTGDQIRGYGFLHDGFVDTLFTFVGGNETFGQGVFQFPGSTLPERVQQRRDLEDFILAFDTNMLPIMGQQVTLRAGDPNEPLIVGGTETADDRIDLMVARAAVTLPRRECVVGAKGLIAGIPRGWKRQNNGIFLDDTGETITDAALRALADVPGQEITFTCMYYGGGNRYGIDRNRDLILDGEQCGDVNGDGVPSESDAHRVRLELAEVENMLLPDKCNVIGASGGGPGTCTIEDVVAIDRFANGVGPGLLQNCPAAL